MLEARLDAAQARAEANSVLVQDARARLTASREKWAKSREIRAHMHEMAFARLLARFETQPVIEQAKGILMAESHCTPDAAFDCLRRASQRQNLPVRDVATNIVARTISGMGPEVPDVRSSHHGLRRQLGDGS